MPALSKARVAALIFVALAGCTRPQSQDQASQSSKLTLKVPAPPEGPRGPKEVFVAPPIADLPNGTSQVGGLTFKATDDAAISLVRTNSDGSARVQGSIPIEIANNSNDVVSIIVAGNGVTVSLNSGKTVENVEVKGLKSCFNTKDQCAIGQRGDFIQVPPAPAGTGASGEPISVIAPFQFDTQAAETTSLRHISSADVVGTLFLTDANGTHSESLHLNRIAMKNFTETPQ